MTNNDETAGGELLPCPFCGGTMPIAHLNGVYKISCLNSKCDVQVATYSGTKNEVISWWNTRDKQR